MTRDAVRRDVCWRCRRNSDFSLRHWADGSVLFDEANGQLQRLTPSAGRMFALFIEKPEWTSGALSKALFGETSLPEDLEIVEQALENFRSLNLVDRLPD